METTLQAIPLFFFFFSLPSAMESAAANLSFRPIQKSSKQWMVRLESQLETTGQAFASYSISVRQIWSAVLQNSQLCEKGSIYPALQRSWTRARKHTWYSVYDSL